MSSVDQLSGLSPLAAAAVSCSLTELDPVALSAHGLGQPRSFRGVTPASLRLEPQYLVVVPPSNHKMWGLAGFPELPPIAELSLLLDHTERRNRETS